MKKLDCPECVAFLTGELDTGPRFWDIPETLKRMRAVWAEQECMGIHTLDAWIENPNGSTTNSE